MTARPDIVEVSTAAMGTVVTIQAHGAPSALLVAVALGGPSGERSFRVPTKEDRAIVVAASKAVAALERMNEEGLSVLPDESLTLAQGAVRAYAGPSAEWERKAMLAQKVDKTLFVGTSAVFFLIVNYTKLVPYYFLGQLNLGNLATALLFSPLAPIGVWLGVWIHRRMSQRVFLNVSFALLLATGAKLIADAMGL